MDEPQGGAQRRITLSVDAADTSSAHARAVNLLTEALGSTLQGPIEVTNVAGDSADAEHKPMVVGDRFPLGADNVGDCAATATRFPGLLAFCVLDTGHAGRHVATDGETIVELWD